MTRWALLATAALLAGCNAPATEQEGNAPATEQPSPPPPLEPAPPPPSVASKPAASLPEPKEAIDPKSVAAAAQVVQRFGALLEERNFAAAHKLWSGAGQASGLSEAEFAASYDKYAEIHAEVGAPGDSEGGAGSIYVDVPLRLYGTLKRGGRFNLVGPVSLRRVNDVDGATPAQLRWHIFQSGLKPRP